MKKEKKKKEKKKKEKYRTVQGDDGEELRIWTRGRREGHARKACIRCIGTVKLPK